MLSIWGSHGELVRLCTLPYRVCKPAYRVEQTRTSGVNISDIILRWLLVLFVCSFSCVFTIIAFGHPDTDLSGIFLKPFKHSLLITQKIIIPFATIIFNIYFPKRFWNCEIVICNNFWQAVKTINQIVRLIELLFV